MKNFYEKYLPINSVGYCLELSSKYDFNLDISFNRKSKFGHYKYCYNTKQHTVSINKGLPPPLFLITLIHEFAHMDVMMMFGARVKPHGKEWKKTFIFLISPLLNQNIFELKLLLALKNHLEKPKASLSTDSELWNVLFPNHTSDKLVFVKDIKVGDSFIFNDRVFEKVKNRRTRVLCFEPISKNDYLIPFFAKTRIVERNVLEN